MEMDLVQRLPEDVLADVLGCLPPRSLAAARCVCWAWHAIIDARCLLDRDLLPLSLAGFFINFADMEFAEFFFRSSIDAAISSDLHFVPTEDVYVEDICNGLVLLDFYYVVNPATRRWASLPPRPPTPMEFEHFREQGYIMFDPAVSLHYQVLLFLHVPYAHKLDAPMMQQEWPPSRFMMRVFSSETTRWEQKSFIRQGDALGTLADMLLLDPPSDQPHAVYWHGELYVHTCHFVMRVSLSNCTYQPIKLPILVDIRQYPTVLLGKSEKGVYFAALDRQCRLRVWILNESSCEWLPKHDNSLHHMPPCQNHEPQTCGSWIMAHVNYNFNQASNPIYNKEASVQDKLEWNSDNEDVFETRIGAHTNEHITILGFHPYKEVIFLSEYSQRGFAYHLDQSKLEDLGSMRPKGFEFCYIKNIDQSFPYTPCRFRKFLDNS
ncbi:unnamed protein product [Alopecurus aequalis]